MLVCEEDGRRPESVEQEETTGRHEREREEENSGIAAPPGCLAGGVAETKSDGPNQPEDHKVEGIVLDVRIQV